MRFDALFAALRASRYPLLALLLGYLLLASVLEFMLQQSRRGIEIEAAQRARASALAAAARVDGLLAQTRLWCDELERLIDPEELRGDAPPDEARLAQLGGWIDDLRRRNNMLANLGFLDAQGRSFRQRGKGGSGLSFADTDFWQQLQALGGKGVGRLVVSSLYRLRTTGQQGLTLARGLYGNDGRLAGAIIVALHVETLEQLLAGLGPGPHSAVLLTDSRSMLVARQPSLRSETPRPMRAQQQAGPIPGSMRVVSSVDGRVRLGASVELREAPFRVGVGLAEEDYLASWQLHRRDLRLALLALTLATLLMAALVVRGARVRHQLQRSESLLGATLAMLPTACLHASGPQRRIAHSNQAAQALLALPASPGIGLLELFEDPEQAGGLLAAVERDGSAGPADMRMRRGGQGFWATVQLRQLQDDGDLLMTLIDIEDRRQREAELQRQSSTDELTGLCNRRCFEADAPRWMAHCSRHRQPLSLMMIDLDHFKAINDRFGHAGGDQVLRAVAAALQSQLRSPDLLARLGGEEFVALLPNTGAEAAGAAAQRVLQQLRATPMVLHDGSTLQVSASIGISACLPDETDVEWALARADEAMYRAKSLGRDRFELQL